MVRASVVLNKVRKANGTLSQANNPWVPKEEKDRTIQEVSQQLAVLERDLVAMTKGHNIR